MHLIGNLDNGGAEAVLVRLVKASAEKEQCVVSLGPRSWYSSELENCGVELHHLNLAGPCSLLGSLRRLIGVHKRFRPDIIQTWMYRANVIGGLWGKLVGVPVVWGIHCSTFAPPFPLHSRALVYFSGLLAHFIPARIINCSSRSAEAHERIGYPAARVVIIPNGYDVDHFRPDPAARSRIGSETKALDTDFLIGTVGRWHPQKDHQTLLKALAIFREAVPTGWKCLLVGASMDHTNKELNAGIFALSLGDLVAPMGQRSDIEVIMRALDVHVLSSAFGEAFPNVVAEAMASGTPPIVTDVGDSRFLVGETGWVVQPRSPDQLASALRQAHGEWLHHKQAWLNRSGKARQRVVENFTISRMVSKYEHAWKSCITEA